MAQRMVSLLSAKSVYIQVQSLGNVIGTATGFVAVHEGRWFLVTNRHVVRGRHNQTDEILHSGGALPEELAVLYPVDGQPHAWEFRTEALHTKKGIPRWREHPTLGGAVDVVAIPIQGTTKGGATAYPYDPWAPGKPMLVRVGVDLFVIGFPFGRTGVGGLGVWVRASVATDPDLDYMDLPAFLVDARTRPGASGSPVVAHSHGGAVAMEDGSVSVYQGSVERFVGAYSGRIHAESDIGIVWKLGAIQEIVADGTRGVD